MHIPGTTGRRIVDNKACLEVYGLRKGDLLMIKGFLLAFDVILIVMFLIGMIFGLKTKETGMGLLSGSIALIIALNSLFILNS